LDFQMFDPKHLVTRGLVASALKASVVHKSHY